MDISKIILLIFLAAVNAVLVGFEGYPLLLHIQLSGYRGRDYFRDLKHNVFLRFFVVGIAGFLLTLLIGVYGFIVYGAVNITSLVYSLTRPKKTPITFTKRFKRLAFCQLIILTAYSFAWLFLFLKTDILLYAALMSISPLFSVLSIGLLAWLIAPFERLGNRKFVVSATKKLDSNPSIIRIGITGSYGKTGVKCILNHILSRSFKVCASPMSFNTPMGICKTINENLSDDDQIFIAEMGARYKGDIKELCDLVRPSIGILTSVGNQHLKTFGSLENIASTKYELIDSLPKDGFAVFNGENTASIPLFDKCTVLKALRGFEGSVMDSNGLTVACRNIKCTEYGSDFELSFLQGEWLKAHTKLLGVHNIQNILLAVTVAHKLGMDTEVIIEQIATLTSPPHRLQILPSGNNNMTVIDDSYNANPEGCKSALEVLKLFSTDSFKTVITCGMVELGVMQKEENIMLGYRISQAADTCIVTGVNTPFLRQGLKNGGFFDSQIIYASSLSEAVKLIPTSDKHRVVLFMNDLPDNI